jgi:riboflavin synthase alpha subunit
MSDHRYVNTHTNKSTQISKIDNIEQAQFCAAVQSARTHRYVYPKGSSNVEVGTFTLQQIKNIFMPQAKINCDVTPM